jgi:hypothetical protein
MQWNKYNDFSWWWYTIKDVLSLYTISDEHLVIDIDWYSRISLTIPVFNVGINR